MFILKKKYYLIIESIKDINLKNIKKRNKFIIIYRSQKKDEKIDDLLKFRNNCKRKSVNFYIANNFKLAVFLKADGVYLSSFNITFFRFSHRKPNFKIIGSAHSWKEINMKVKQGCEVILLSKLFLVSYDKKAPYLGVLKFNNFLKLNKKLIPLGGINQQNLSKMNAVNSDGIALMSEVKKKPAKIFSRLF